MHGNLAKLFHRQSRARKIPAGDPKFWPKEWTTIYFKEYPRAERHFLTKTDPPEGTLGEALSQRKTERNFENGKTITFEELSTILHFSVGLRNPNQSSRFYPSAGPRYPIETYVCVKSMIGLNPGIYHYNVKEDCLEKIQSSDINLAERALLYPWARKAPVFLFFTSVWDRNFTKYREFGYRAVLLEAGYLGENVLLLANLLNIKACPLLGFENSDLETAARIEHTSDEDSLIVTLLGK